MADLAWIEPGFAIGSRPYVPERGAIARAGIQAIVALHEPGEGEAEAWRKLGVEFEVVPTPDWVAIPRACFTSAVEAVLRRMLCVVVVRAAGAVYGDRRSVQRRGGAHECPRQLRR